MEGDGGGVGDSERVIFLEEIQEGSVKVLASGEVTLDLLEGLEGFARRQRARLDAGLPTAEDVRGIIPRDSN